jgi:nucleoside phosphorylase
LFSSFIITIFNTFPQIQYAPCKFDDYPLKLAAIAILMIEFSKFLGAVKKNERTDQYLILAALYCLSAQLKPVSTKQISDIFNLHLTTNKPSNPNASLRSYIGLVSPAKKGPPILWSLTPEGLHRLRTLSGLQLKSETDSTEFESDIAIVCALEFPEFEAVMKAFNENDWVELPDPKYTHIYRESSITTVDNETLRIVGTTSTSMGLTAAAIATTQLLMQFKPRIVVMIGIAAGTRSGGKQFGDILTADPSIDYNSGKVVDDNGIRDFQPDPYPIGLNPRLRSVLAKYRGNHPVFEKIRRQWKGPIPAKGNHLHVGPLGAADQVIDDASRIIEIQKNWRKLIGVEMETYGVYRAVHEAPEPKPRVASFKSVCDFAAEKTDSWQEYAAYTAATFAYEFLKNEWAAIWPQKKS